MISKSVEETGKIAGYFASELQPQQGHATVIALEGDLGSGKTTFTKAFAAALGIAPEAVTSPTFVIEKRFDIGDHAHFTRLVHIDAYRLEKPEEIEKLDWKETLADPENLIVVEWPGNIAGAIPEDAVRISFKFVDKETREITFV